MLLYPKSLSVWGTEKGKTMSYEKVWPDNRAAQIPSKQLWYLFLGQKSGIPEHTTLFKTLPVT